MNITKTIDIIIPVYNAVDELKDCVDSLLAKTNYDNYRIVIINDCSPDQKVNEYLETIKSNDKIIILHNKVNLGFVGTVNRGMAFSEHDVVLLNSDTVVTKGWLRKLVEAAYLDHSIATVTPLTNNGTICSVPKFCEDNQIPEGFTVDSFAQLIEKISLDKFPEIPTAVGFCMYIKREVLNKVGLFDAETFGKGYAEENDFCCRAIEHGYKNIIADNTFIYHKGSMSFQGDKLKLLNKNLKVLNSRYPYYEKNVSKFITSNPLKDIHDNINIQIEYYKNQENNNGNILFVLHNFFDEKYNHSIGGTEYHVKDIITGLENINAFVMVTNNLEIIVKKYFNGNLVGKYRFELNQPITLTHFTHKQYKEIAEKIITTFDINLIHIHHLRTHTLDIPHIAKKYSIKVLYTLHDFHFFCPKVNLLDENNNYCIDMRGELKCQQCLRKEYHFNTPFINVWRENIEKMMDNIDLFICPSTSTESMFRNEFATYFNRNNNIITIEHGMTKQKNKSIKEKNTPLRLGFLGGLSPTKGSNLIYKVITGYSNKNVEWHLIGELGDQKLNLLEQSNVIKHGPYQRENLKELLESIDIDVICLFSIWPETYSYTLTESWMQDIPVLVLPMGALKERVEKVGGGWVTKDLELNSIFESLDHILSINLDEWNQIISRIQDSAFKNKKEMVNEYINIYTKYMNYNLFTNLSGPISFSNNEILNSTKYFVPAPNSISMEAYNNKLNEVEKELNLIKSTVGWKVLNKLRGKNPLILKVGKKVIFNILKLRKSSQL